MSNLGMGIAAFGGLLETADDGRALDAPLIKKCAILAMGDALDQLYGGKCDECCAMLRRVAPRCHFLFQIAGKRLIVGNCKKISACCAEAAVLIKRCTKKLYLKAASKKSSAS
ncbi:MULTISPECIES: hypothetical protein [Pseudomonas]|uniref:hypothetical protein n=1 Tax=Pseudomonas sp. Ost2 TaxID=2678260 RepID=UPI001FD065D6|nr:hypothetical protein [Pseudomonas sp. Ost2]